MRHSQKIGVVIPALNEAEAIGRVITSLPGWIDKIIVADNGSTDDTPGIARSLGAGVVVEKQGAYGAACIAGIAKLPDCDIIGFIDGDYSDYPEQIDRLVDPIAVDGVDLVIGSRRLGDAEPGALTLQQRFGNWLACCLIRTIWGVSYSDLGPFRAIKATALNRLNMQDRAFGWTVEMQVRAIEAGLVVREIPVDYRNRIGQSKISGTIGGTLKAGHAILSVIFKHALSRWF